MADSPIQLGVLTNIQLTNLQALIKGQNSDQVYLSQNSLTNKLELDKLVNGELVFFKMAVRKPSDEGRLKATYCSLTLPESLQEFLLALDTPFSRQSSPAFRRALLPELEKLIADATDSQVITHLTAIKNELLPQEAALPVAPVPTSPPIPAPQPEAAVSTFRESAFLHHVFTANSPDYTSRLFPLLVEGVRAISDDDSFQQALFLLDFNAQLAEGKISDLQTTFYMLAAPAYRFQFWLRGIVPYCDTDTLLVEFTNGSEALKRRVLQRCQGDAGALLTTAAAPPAAAPVLQAYFHDIKAAILKQLIAAQSSIRVAVAWFTHDELFAVLCEKRQQGVEVELVINNDYINNGEHGLPFDEFITLGGKLYLSEHPAMMHHKFCLIDEAILFTGSYNWTYYATLYNEENVLRVSDSPAVVAAFNAEFERLKQQVGSPAVTAPRFVSDELDRFERISFRSYLSKDIHSRVAHIQKSRPLDDPQKLATLLKKAIELDNENTEASQLLPHVITDTYAVRAQQKFQQQLVAFDSAQPKQLASPSTSSSVPISPPSRQVASVVSPVPPAAPTPRPTTLPPAAPRVAAATGTLVRSAATPGPAAISGAGINAVSTLVTKPTSAPDPSTKVTARPGALVVNTQRTPGQYENLQIVFALDYSNSMESHQGGGYKLYSSGKIQQVINMLFGIAKGLTTAEKIDMFLFEDKVIPLPEVTKENYSTYVQDEVLNKPMGGTNIYAPILAIHEKYATAFTAKTNVFVILITDGENSKPENNAKIKAHFAAHHDAPIFWQFVGLGAKFAFLETVAAAAPNAAFFSLNDVQSVSNDTLLERLLQKFPEWFQATAAK